MATNGMMGLLGDALSNPLIGLGAGLLSAPQGSTFGQQLGHGVQFASGLQQQSMRNEVLRESLKEKQAEREAIARRQEAHQRLIDLVAPDGGGEGQGAPVSLLGGFPEAQPGQPQAAPAGASQRQLLGLLAEANPDQFTQGLLGQIFNPPQPEKPTTFQRDFEFLVNERGLSEADALDRLRKGTTVNVGDNKMDQPLSVNDLENIRTPNGETLPIGTTPREARDAGARVMSSDEIQTGQKADEALAILDELETMALGTGGDPGIFTNVEPGFVNRAKAAIDFGLELVEQNDPRVSRFKDLGEGSISTFVKMLGEKGALSEGDVTRALGLLPRIFPLPDTGDVAKDKLNDLRGIINRGVRNLDRGELPGKKTQTQPSAGQDFSGMDPQQLLGVDVTTLSPAARSAYSAALDAAGL